MPPHYQFPLFNSASPRRGQSQSEIISDSWVSLFCILSFLFTDSSYRTLLSVETIRMLSVSHLLPGRYMKRAQLTTYRPLEFVQSVQLPSRLKKISKADPSSPPCIHHIKPGRPRLETLTLTLPHHTTPHLSPLLSSLLTLFPFPSFTRFLTHFGACSLPLRRRGPVEVAKINGPLTFRSAFAVS